MKAFWERLKAMPTWQKIVLVLAVVGVVGFALYMRSKNSKAQTAPTTLSSGLLNGVDTYGNPLNNNGYSGLPGYGGTPPSSGGTTTTTSSSGTSISPAFLGPPTTTAIPTITTAAGDTFASLAQKSSGKWTAQQIQQASFVRYPWLAPYGSNQPLPAGLSWQMVT